MFSHSLCAAKKAAMLATFMMKRSMTKYSLLVDYTNANRKENSLTMRRRWNIEGT